MSDLSSFPKIFSSKLIENPILFIITVFVVNGSFGLSSDLSPTTAMHYLTNYGYLPPSRPVTGGIISEKALHRALSEFQSFAGINVTGVLDQETAFLMSLPRCGVKDKNSLNYKNRSKRYALQGSKWRINNLTYKITKYPRALDRDAVDVEIAKAFSVWSEYTDLTFIPKKSGQVHIEVRFERGDHGDGDPFDGPGGTLAHAYFPVYGGDAHFDDSERWTINSFRGTNLFQVAAHEFGHSLGLSHSDVRSALMAPFYRGYDPNFMLDSDDIQGIQALYGLKSEFSRVGTKHFQRTTNLPPTKEEDSQLCLDSKIDTIFDSAEGETYIFKGQYYWRSNNEGIVSGYPRLINESWKELPANIDAAFTYKNGKTYFFKGSRYWRYIDKTLDGYYPKDISEGFTGIPDNIDAASTWTGNGKIYFFKGSKFWKFDPSLKPPVKSIYPKLISIWEGIPDNIDALLSHNGHTYFFKDKEYYRFNDRTFSVDIATPVFPRATAYWWFGCRSSNKDTLTNLQWHFENKPEIFIPNFNDFTADSNSVIGNFRPPEEIELDTITET